MSSPNPRPLHDHNAIRETFVRIPEGRFLMGGGGDDKFVSAVELPQRKVSVGAFLLARIPVTEADWARFPGSNAPDHFTSSRLPLARPAPYRERRAPVGLFVFLDICRGGEFTCLITGTPPYYTTRYASPSD